MRVVTYNIRLALDSSLARVGAIIRQLGADVACLQEVGRHWVMGEPVDMCSWLIQETGLDHGLFAPAIQRGEAQYGIALLSRFPVRLVARRPLPRLEDEPRVLLACLVEEDQADWLLLTTHLSVVPVDRPAQMEDLARFCQTNSTRKGHPLVLAGDFNAAGDDPEMQRFVARLGLHSAVETIHQRPLPTYPTRAPKVALDHILTAPPSHFTDAGVAELAGSDHLPVWADLSV